MVPLFQKYDTRSKLLAAADDPHFVKESGDRLFMKTPSVARRAPPPGAARAFLRHHLRHDRQVDQWAGTPYPGATIDQQRGHRPELREDFLWRAADHGPVAAPDDAEARAGLADRRLRRVRRGGEQRHLVELNNDNGCKCRRSSGCWHSTSASALPRRADRDGRVRAAPRAAAGLDVRRGEARDAARRAGRRPARSPSAAPRWRRPTPTGRGSSGSCAARFFSCSISRPKSCRWSARPLPAGAAFDPAARAPEILEALVQRSQNRFADALATLTVARRFAADDA